MGRVKLLMALVLLVSLTGCAATMSQLRPEERAIIQTRVFSASYDQVFRAVIEAFQDGEYVIREANPEIGLIDSDWKTLPYGSVMRAIWGDMRGKANAMVTEVEPDVTRVRLTFVAEIRSSFGGWSRIDLPQRDMERIYTDSFRKIEVKIFGEQER